MNFVPSKDELQHAYEFMKGKGIPKMPDIVLELQKECAQYEPNLRKVGTILEKDMALSGLVLKTVNSANFGLQRKVESIPHATMLLGLNTLKDAVLISALKVALGEQSQFQELIWRVSQGNALGAKALAFDMEGISVDSAYLAGLFHDVGALLMEKMHPDYPKYYRQGLIAPVSALKEETDHFGTNHAVIGFLLAKHWALPESVCTAIYHCHSELCAEFEDSEVRGLVAILKITSNTTTHILYPEIDFSDEAINLLADAYMEIAITNDSMREMSLKVSSGVL